MWETVPKGKENKVINVTWRASVDVRFRYIVSIYFSMVGFAKPNIGGFKIHINEMIACSNIDIIGERDGTATNARHRDFMVMMNGYKQEGKRDILIYLETSDEFLGGHGPLKGFEVMKLSNPDNSLAAPNPIPSAQNLSYLTVKNILLVLGQKNILAFYAMTLLSLVNIIIYVLWKLGEDGSVQNVSVPSARAERLCRRFSLAEIQLATGNFSNANFIGRGGFGKVYKGLIDNGQQMVALKRLRSNSGQGAHEFSTKIETLTELRHVNLVSLIGYCSERGEMILVYEYVTGATLAHHLYKVMGVSNNHSSLTWKQRLNICIGAGRGREYLHTGHSLIHRDVKSSNILLDEEFVPKVSDFGLARYLRKNRRMRQSRAEIMTAGNIRHRNILPLLAHMSQLDFHYLVYDYMKNGSLDNYLQQVADGRAELNWLARYKIALGIASGLEHLHMHHNSCIIHRDLKAGNILLDDEMEARITDFGLAKGVPDAFTHVTTSNVAGTKEYIAPEYYQTFKFSDKCDVYSLGVVLGVLVLGKLPSDGFFQLTDERCMPKWMRNMVTSDDPKRGIDLKLLGNGYEEQMLRVLKVAYFCTLENPKERHNSKEVRCMLSQISH